MRRNIISPIFTCAEDEKGPPILIIIIFFCSYLLLFPVNYWKYSLSPEHHDARTIMSNLRDDSQEYSEWGTWFSGTNYYRRARELLRGTITI